MIGVDMGMSIELASGAVRQMDRENKERDTLLYEQLTAIENRLQILEIN